MTAMHILVVDDDRLSRQTTTEQLRAAGHVAEAAESGFAALERLAAMPWDVMITDLRMPGMDGLALLEEALRLRPGMDVIVMTAYGTVETAVAAMREGAADYLTKPFRFSELEVRLQRLAEQRAARQEFDRLKGLLDDHSVGAILGRSPAMLAACDLVRRFAGNSAPVLITGETGTGKEVFARAIHDLSPRRHRSFVAVACGAIPRELAEAQFFGHEKGAFTGAIARRRGLFEEASGGTFMLDDLDDLPLDVQAKLLRVLQEYTIRPVGAEADVRVDVRVIATTKVDLEQRVHERQFREDLFYRLRGLEIHLPPLRERGDDVLLLAQHFLRLLASKEGTEPKVLTPEVAGRLRAHSWPGNVRELRRVIETGVVLAPDAEIRLEHLPAHLQGNDDDARPFALHLDAQTQVNLHALVKEFETEVIEWAMRRAQGQQTLAAQLLEIPRTTLQSKLGTSRS